MKPIAGPNSMPFGLGGFCVSGALINGVKYKSLNIYQQRSSTLFDLIDGNGTIHEYIQLVHTDTKHQKLDATASSDVLLDKIFDNSFFIKTTDPNTLVPIFVYQYQSNLIKLSNGTMSFKPWGYINFCNAIDENSPISPSLSTLIASPTAIHANGSEYSVLTLTIRDTDGNLVTNVTSGVVFHVTGFSSDDKYTINNINYSKSNIGIVTAHLFGTEETTAVVSSSVGAVNIDQTATVQFAGNEPLDEEIDPTQTTFVVPEPMNTNTPYNIVITLRDAEGNLVKKPLITTIHIESSDGNVTIGETDYSEALTNGIIKIPVSSAIQQTAYFIIRVGGVVLTQYGTMNFVEVIVPNFQVSISPSTLSVYAGDRDTFTASYVGTGIDNISKAGTWTTNASDGDVTIHSDSTNVLDITFNTAGSYTITYTSTYDPSKTATATVTAIATPDDFTSVYGEMTYVDNKLDVIIGGGQVWVGPPVNPNTTMCIMLKYFPEDFIATSYGTFECTKFNRENTTYEPIEEPFNITNVSADFTKIYIKFDKGATGNYRVRLHVPHPTSNETVEMIFPVLLLNANGTNQARTKISTMYRNAELGSAIKMGRSLPLAISYQYSFNPNSEYNNLKPLPYKNDVSFSTSPVLPTDIACNINSDSVFTSSGSEGDHTIYATFTDTSYNTSKVISITDNLPSQWGGIIPESCFVTMPDVAVPFSAYVIPNTFNDKIKVNMLKDANTDDPNLIYDTVNNTIEFKTGYARSAIGWISVLTGSIFPINPIKSSIGIGNPTIYSEEPEYTINLVTALGDYVSNMTIGGLYQFSGRRSNAAQTSSQENVIISFNDDSYFQKITPLYYSTGNSITCNNVYYRALKPGLVTVTMFFPISNKTVVKDYYIFPQP